MKLKTVLTIAGSDCSGGAGIQADLKTIAAHGLYGMSAITALTAQNTTGVFGVRDTDAAFVGLQIDCVFDDIPPDAVKIGMVSNKDIISVIAKKLTERKAGNIVADPVMVSTSGCRLISEDAAETLIAELLSIADVITPNIPEAEVLCGFGIRTKDDMIRAAETISKSVGGAILIKGGHFENRADDLLFFGGSVRWYPCERIGTSNTHGTGCTLSSAIACNLAAGFDIADAVANAKNYITGALKSGLDLGRGSGPLDHGFRMR